MALFSINKKVNKRRKAYSLIEILVSLTIVAFAMTVMLNFLIIGLKLDIISLNRSFVREELSNITTLITRDIRNASSIGSAGCSQSLCSLNMDNGDLVTWQICANSICKSVLQSGSGSSANVFISAAPIIINSFNFTNGYVSVDPTVSTKTSINIIITISGSHINQSLKINNIIKQASASLRNF